MDIKQHLQLNSGVIVTPSEVRSFPAVCGVYAITNVVTGAAYYGSSVNLRVRLVDHVSDLRRKKHWNPHLQKAWNKYGEESFCLVLVEISKKEILRDREQAYLDGIENKYNILKHAKPVPDEWEQTPDVKQYLRDLKTGVPVHTLEQREKWSRERRGQPASPAQLAHIQRLANESRGKKLKPEHRDKVVASRDAYWATPESRQQASALRKQHPEWIAAAQAVGWTEERRVYISELNKEHPEWREAAQEFARSEEGRESARKNISKYNEWQKTPEGRAAQSVKSKKVQQELKAKGEGNG